MPGHALRRTIISIRPADALRQRQRLFGALAAAFRISFVADGTAAAREAAAAIVFDRALGLGPDLPAKVFVVARARSLRASSMGIAFSASESLDRRLRRRVLADSTADPEALGATEGDDVLATIDGRPIWLKRRDGARVFDIAAHVPEELASDRYLRDEIVPGRFIRVLPLVHFLREVLSEVDPWTPPPPRAAFVIDDPNLHWRSYGYLNYSELVRHARDHNYHLAIGMVPIDAWYSHPPTVRLFASNSDVVSIAIQGRDHLPNDLARAPSVEIATRHVADARHRIDRFEVKTRLTVSRIMIPPYEALSPHTVHAMADAGFEAAVAARPYSWLPHGNEWSPYSAPSSAHSLSGWHIAELLEPGFPVMIRRSFAEHEDVVFRSYLDQPMILYGHTSDLAEGLGSLETAAAEVNSIRDVLWSPLHDVARRNFEQRRSGSCLWIRPYALHVRVQLTPEIEEVRVEPPPNGAFASAPPSIAGQRIGESRWDVGAGALYIDRRDRPTSVEISWLPRRRVAVRGAPPRPALAWAVIRRALAEARDRAKPFLPHRRFSARRTGGGRRGAAV